MKLTALACTLACTVGIGHAFAADNQRDGNDTLKRFVGFHTLVRAPEGPCEETLDVFINDDRDGRSVDAGSHFFPRVNQGAFTTDDPIEHSATQSYTQGENLLIFKDVNLTKAKGFHRSEVTELEILTNGNVQLRSRLTDEALSEIGTMVWNCTYKTVANPNNFYPNKF